MIAPPPKMPLRTATMDEHPRLRRIHFRLWQIGLTAAIVLVTGWCYTLSPVAGIAVTFLAKHVLVAILVVGLDLPDD